MTTFVAPDHDDPLVLGTLPDRRQLYCRPLRVDDSAAAHLVNGNLSPRSSYFRYFGLRTAGGEGEVRRILAGDPDRLSLLGLIGNQPVALAEIDGLDADRPSELALFVDEVDQGLGVGTLLLGELVRRAARYGIRRLSADVLPGKQFMLEVLWACGLKTAISFEQGLERVVVTLPWT